ncbi:nitrilase-related carbon-nitrogen hydrolase [Marinobacterium stanieri]|uniref:Predicted amidohydrolase n=1 Tax=Marinobacterium stanieri TaxID=49186 RepID=A0A1N6QEW5_9GAMM|nr:nitrilase-related carbon-nitrogen hydrolase [Marinobacterium stanieri]SIQ15062.1 Predicted amidohydrolase [Marinobacterium stanieri]
MNTSPLLVGVVQLNSELLALESNLSTHADWIRTAQSESLELLLFPELSLTGYQLGRRTPEAAMRADDERLKSLARIAPNMTVVVGFVEQASPGEYYNAVAYLRQGEIAAVYRKINLPTYGGLEEGKWYHPGEELVQVECKPNWTANTLICADLWNPALVHCAMLRRPELLLAPVNSASAIVSDEFSNENNWQTNVSFYAMLYGVPVLMANRYGAEGDAWFWGGSRILGPRGEVLAQAEDRECLISAELDLNSIAAARFDHPAIRDANTLLIQRLLNQS